MKLKRLLPFLLFSFTLSCQTAQSFLRKEPLKREILKKETNLKVHFPDVGQGSVALIEYFHLSENKKKFILYDCGPDEMAEKTVAYLGAAGVRELDLILSHEDADHIGGCDEILGNFQVNNIFDNGQVDHCDNTFCNDYKNLLFEHLNSLSCPVGTEERKFKKNNFACRIKKDAKLTLDNLILEFIAPYDAPLTYTKAGQRGGYSGDSNTNSLVLKLTYGKLSFLLTGDCTSSCQSRLLKQIADLAADIYQVPHHGMGGSTERIEFLEKVNPQIAVIQIGWGGKKSGVKIQHYRDKDAGKKIYFCHDYMKGTHNYFLMQGIETYRTNQCDGYKKFIRKDIIFETDGLGIKIMEKEEILEKNQWQEKLHKRYFEKKEAEAIKSRPKIKKE